MSTPDISIIIPVYREQETIHKTLEQFKTPSQATTQLIVVDGAIEKDTIAQIKDPSIICLDSKKGRGHQLNKGAAHASGRILLFLHADTLLPSGALDDIKTVLDTHPSIDAGAFDLGFDTTEWGYPLFAFLSSLRSRLTRIPYGDQAHFIRTECFKEIGGFEPYPILEDVALMEKIKKLKKNIHIFRKKVRTSPRRWQKEGRIQGTLRNWKLIRKYKKGHHPETLLENYKTHA